jgi:hypothetical protein
MERSVRAALLSALVFPGAGQLYLRLRIRALLFIVPALGAVAVFLAQVWDLVNLISAEIAAGQVGLDPVAIAQRVELQAGSSGGSMDPAGRGLTVALWVDFCRPTRTALYKCCT